MALKPFLAFALVGAALCAASVATAGPVPLPELPALPAVCPDPVGASTPVGIDVSASVCDGVVQASVTGSVTTPDLPLPPLPDLPL